MSKATGQGDRPAVKPAASETLRDLYDPHFPIRQRAKDASDRAADVPFDPHFPSRKRH